MKYIITTTGIKPYQYNAKWGSLLHEELSLFSTDSICYQTKLGTYGYRLYVSIFSWVEEPLNNILKM